MGKYLKAGIILVGAISCLALVISSLENLTTSTGFNSSAQRVLKEGQVLAEATLSNSYVEPTHQDKLNTLEDTPIEVSFDEFVTEVDPVLLKDIAVPPSHGRVELDSDTTMYIPEPNFNGDDKFAVQLTRGIGNAITIAYNVTVTPVNDNPTSEDDSILVAEDAEFELQVLENDYDIDGDKVSIVSISDALHGSARISDNKLTIIYEPRQDYAGDDRLYYTIADSVGMESKADVLITVGNVNDNPLAEDDLVLTDEDVPVDIVAMSNDVDEDNDELSILSVTDPSNGSVRISNAGKIMTYYPSNNFYGTDEFQYKISDGSLSDTATVRVVVESVNDSPVANAGRDLTITEGGKIILDGSDSFDPDGSIVSYKWEPIRNPEIAFDISEEDNGKIVELVTSNITSSIELTFRLTVVDDDGRFSSDEVTFIVKKTNRAPTANAGSDIPASAGETIFLDGSKSFDPDGDRLTYSWKQASGPIATLAHGNSTNTSVLVPSIDSGDAILTFILRVEDANGGSDEDTVRVIVKSANQPPTADPQEIGSVNEGDRVELDGTHSSDPDGDPLTYSWTQLKGSEVSLSSPNSAKATFTAPYYLDEDEELIFELRVSDGNLVSKATVTVTVNNSIGPPKILGTPHYLRDLINEIDHAEEYVYASTYYVEDYPENGLLDALENAAKRGVDVKLTFAIQTLVLYPSVEQDLIDRGIPYKIVTNHAKVVVIDDKIVYVGSANWNQNGLERSMELSIKLGNPDTIKEAKEFVEAMWKTGSKISRHYDYSDDQFVNGPEFFDLLLDMIRDAHKVKVLMFEATYNFDDSNAPDSILLNEIKSAYGRGTDLQLLFDDPQYHITYGGKQFLTKNNIPHKLDDKTTGSLEKIHAKAVLIDDEILILGSQNWTRDALDSSSEASIITRNPETISEFLDIFEQKWNAGHYVVGG